MEHGDSFPNMIIFISAHFTVGKLIGPIAEANCFVP